MKTLRILLIIFLISLAVCAFVNMQTVKAANPTVPAPTLNPASPITLGVSVTASITVTGSAGTPTGNVTFQYSNNSGSSWTQLGVIKTLSNGSATSDSYTPTAVGNQYRIRAVYSGDSNYKSVTGSARSLTVNAPSPTPVSGNAPRLSEDFFRVKPVVQGSVAHDEVE